MYQNNFWILYTGLEPRDDGTAIGPESFDEVLQQRRTSGSEVGNRSED
jgi:hypothetical protein